MRSSAKRKIRRAFDKSAGGYDHYADVQNETAIGIARDIAALGLTGDAVLDIGCGTGTLAARLARSGAFAKALACDLSPGMVQQAASRGGGIPSFHAMIADADHLPVRNRSVDVVVSSMTLQWVEDLAVSFRQIARALKPGGRFIAATLGATTLKELREALRAVISGGAGEAEGMFHRFATAKELRDSLTSAGFTVSVSATHDVRTYQSLHHLLRTLKRVGAQNNAGLSALGLGRREVMTRLAREYHARFTVNGRIRATYEVVRIDAVLAREPGAG